MHSVIPGFPEPTEYDSSFANYVLKVKSPDVLAALRDQPRETVALLERIGAERSSLPYAPGKWTVKQAIGHLMDTERIWAYRALRFARADRTPLSSFEQDDYVRNAPFDAYPLDDLIGEFRCIRQGTLYLFERLPEDAWQRSGPCGGGELSVRALAYMIAGHELHHRGVLLNAGLV